jgi:hypothetical protein
VKYNKEIDVFGEHEFLYEYDSSNEKENGFSSTNICHRREKILKMNLINIRVCYDILQWIYRSYDVMSAMNN